MDSKKMTYKQWMKQVNDAMESIAGLAAEDLPDYLYADDYASHTRPVTAAKRALKDAGW